MGEKHISFSQLNMLLKCGEQFRRRYVQGEIIAPSGSMVRGRSCHKAEEKNFVQKMKSNIDLPTEEVKAFFSDEWEKDKYQIQWTEEELSGDSPSKKEGEYKDVGVSLVEVYHTEIAPSTIPEAVEEKFTVQFDGGYPNLTGIIDRIDEGGQVIDLKFVGRSPSEDDLQKDIQITAYDYGYRATRKKKPFLLKKEYAVATKKPKTVIQQSEARDDETINRFLRRLESAMTSIEKGNFLPASHGWWGCSPKWCGWWSTCKVRP
jgi:hypothetical protein